MDNNSLAMNAFCFRPVLVQVIIKHYPLAWDMDLPGVWCSLHSWLIIMVCEASALWPPVQLPLLQHVL